VKVGEVPPPLPAAVLARAARLRSPDVPPSVSLGICAACAGMRKEAEARGLLVAAGEEDEEVPPEASAVALRGGVAAALGH
jgi:hypothetical protein